MSKREIYARILPASKNLFFESLLELLTIFNERSDSQVGGKGPQDFLGWFESISDLFSFHVSVLILPIFR